MIPLTIVILAAGKGTRMKSERPKVLHPLMGRPMLAYSLDLTRALEPSEILVVIGYKADMVRKAFQEWPVKFVLQDPQEGTAHAVKTALREISQETGTLLILSGDAPLLTEETLRGFLDTHNEQKSLLSFITAVLSDPYGYGRVVRGKNGQVISVIEETDAGEKDREIKEVNGGIYLMELPFLREAIDKVTSQNSQREFYLTDLIAIAGQWGKLTTFRIKDFREILGINTMAELSSVEKILEERFKCAV